MPFPIAARNSLNPFICVLLATAGIPSAAQDTGKAPIPARPAQEIAPSTPAAGESRLAWDNLSKVHDAKPGEIAAIFDFRVTNRSSSEIAIQSIQTSCGCTVAELPPLPAAPFVLAPAASTSIRVTVDLRGKAGAISKTVAVKTSAENVTLVVQVNIPALPAQTGVGEPMSGDRVRNMQIAASDRQAVFKGDCAKCHAEPAAGKLGQELYLAACSICHDAPHRAAMIPDLSVPRGPRDLAFWKKWVTEGGPGTMMPAFAATHGGPLTEEQVGSVALYLFATYSRSSLPGSPPPAMDPHPKAGSKQR